MVKILGLPFDDYVNDQVDVRQAKLAKHQKDPEDLVVFNSNTSWVRLSSAVKVDADKASALDAMLGIGVSQIQGIKLAENLVLFGGTTPYPSGSQGTFRGGVGYGLDNSYGFLTQTAQGLKPMPGITQISVTSKNNGSLKQAQVSIKCYSRAQFEALEAVYLRLGYTMVLEWGHSVWFDNDGAQQTTTLAVMPELLFSTDADITPEDAIAKLTKWKKERAGNYDGVVARVSNYSWSLNSDLSFDIKLDLISVGDLIDSLKANIGATGSPITISVEAPPGAENLTTILVNQNTSKINKFLYELWNEVFGPLVAKYGAGDEKKLVEAAVETTTALTKTQEIVEKTWIPAVDAIEEYGKTWKAAGTAAQQYFNRLKQSTPATVLPAFTSEETEALQKLVDLFKSSGLNFGTLYRSGAIKFEAPTDIRQAYRLFIREDINLFSKNEFIFEQDEITIASDFITATNGLKEFLQKPGEILAEKAADFNNVIEKETDAKDNIIRALDVGFLDKDEKLKVPDNIKFETKFDSTYFSQLLEVLLKYDAANRIDV
jgi:hypothetical protein